MPLPVPASTPHADRLTEPQPTRPAEQQRTLPAGYRDIARSFAEAAENLDDAGRFKDDVASKWMEIKGIKSDEAFGKFVKGLIERVDKTPANTIEAADRLAAQGQLGLALALDPDSRRQYAVSIRKTLLECSSKLNDLFGGPAPGQTATTPAPTKPKQPVADKSPEEAARDKYGYLINQAKALIKTNLHAEAKKKLQRVIDEAPGTEVAAEAKALLDSIPN